MTSNARILMIVGIGLLGGCATSSRTTVAVTDGSTASVGVFYETLAPYGEWVYVGEYGRVWRPSVTVVGAGFRPYGPGGHWVNTDRGWSFETEWGWGWAPFHYGRWYLEPRYGWVWIPGSVWAPAWVTWRYGGGYVGWAPLPPAGAPVVVETYHPYWCFVETRWLVARDVYHYAMPVQNYHVAFSATVTVQQTMGAGANRWNAGPPVGQVSREIGQPIHTASVTPPPPGRVQTHQISPAHAVGAAPNAEHAGAATVGSQPASTRMEPVHGPAGESSPRAATRDERAEHQAQGEQQVPTARPGHEEHEGREMPERRSEVPAGHVASQSHAAPPAPPPPPGAKRRRR